MKRRMTREEAISSSTGRRICAKKITDATGSKEEEPTRENRETK
jgi:hypothetical protein